MMKATPEFDKESDKWVIDVTTEDGEIIPVGNRVGTIDKELTVWRVSTWDTKEQAESWINSRPDVLTLVNKE